MHSVNQKIIDAIIAKSEKTCPGSLALIGIYGSVATGDEYEKSDLDLLILLQDDDGRKLATGFILDDSGVGYDIYCTDWNGLKYDAECHHAHLSKLLDSQIIYVKNQEAHAELCRLRENAQRFLQSEERLRRADELVKKAKVCYADSHLHESPGQVRVDAYGVMYYLLDAIMLYHGTYFKLGVKRTFEELAKLPIDRSFMETMQNISTDEDVSQLRVHLKKLLLYAEDHIRQDITKEIPSEKLSGTYEEMFSNWRNKVEEAADRCNAFAAFMNMCSLQHMLSEIASEFTIGTFNIMEEYDPVCLKNNVGIYDRCLREYEEIYRTAGIAVKRYADVDAFVADYLK